MGNIAQEIAAAIEQAEAKGQRVTRIVISTATLEELQTQTIRPSEEMQHSPAFGIPVMVNAFMDNPFLLITEDITGLLTAMSKFVQKLNEARLARLNETSRRELQLRVGKHRFSAN